MFFGQHWDFKPQQASPVDPHAPASGKPVPEAAFALISKESTQIHSQEKKESTEMKNKRTIHLGMSGALKMNLKNIPQKNFLLLFGCSLLNEASPFFLKSVQIKFQKPIQKARRCFSPLCQHQCFFMN